ncbi:MAG: hypothetical protein GF320_13345 [Armatimonadia bacterium]|nr:hypothetical protein [Armatimonadia bacterium]
MADLRARRVLLLEPDPEVLQRTRRLLIQSRFEVHAASGGPIDPTDAPGGVDIAVIDQAVCDGPARAAVVAALREHDPLVGVILVAHSGDERVAANALRQGLDDYLIPPLSDEELLASVRETAARVEARRRTADEVDQLRQRLSDLEASAGHEGSPRIPLVARDLAAQTSHRLEELLEDAERITVDPSGVLQGAERLKVMMGRLRSLQAWLACYQPTGAVTVGPTSFARALDEALATCAGQAEAGGVELRPQFDGPVPRVLAEPACLERALTGVLTFSIQEAARRDHGRVSLLGSVEDKHVRMVIADNGRGTSPKAAAEMLHFLSPGAESPATRALLLGARERVEAMGGSLSVQAEMGKGHRFRIELRTAPDASRDYLSR